MSIKVLVVDDSVFFRNRICSILRDDGRITVIGTAKNGVEAVEMADRMRPDVITMDVEMPLMDGIAALKKIMARTPCPVLMLSTLTRRSASVTLEALESGAADYMPKDAKVWVEDADKVRRHLTDKIVALGNKSSLKTRASTTFQPSESVITKAGPSGLSKSEPVVEARSKNSSVSSLRMPSCQMLAIGSSTGGPAALQKILPLLPANLPMPVLLIQHMPKTFTSVFASRLNELCQISVKEAEDGDRLLPGHAYLAPGGAQMILDPAAENTLKIFNSGDRVTYRPSVDLTFASLAKAYGRRTLAIVLTGMGSDGCEGAKLLKQKGAEVWAQDQDSCTIYGMPKAVVSANLADHVLSLDDIGKVLQRGGR